MRIDLHCHSLHSDGSRAARDVAEMAFARGVELFSLTDHDTCEGYDATLSAFPGALRGVELSCVEDGHTVHLLLYSKGANPKWKDVLGALHHQQEARRERVYTIAGRLKELGIELDADELIDERKGVVGRPHIAQKLVDSGVVSSVPDAFDRFLKDGGPADVVVNRLSLAEGLALGRHSGAKMSLAHPHVHGQRAEEYVALYKNQGLSGLECYYAQYKSKERKGWLGLADEHGLVATGGSDFHGETLPKVKTLGVDIPDERGQALREWLEL